MARKKPDLIPEGPVSFLKLLSKEKIPFIVIGGAALALHGIPRSTLDIDLIIPTHQDIIVKLLAISKKLKFNCEQKDIISFIDRPDLLIGQLLTFEDSKGNELIDVFLEDSKSFSQSLKRAIQIKTKYFTLNVASLKNLEQMKKKSGRLIDLADLALIQERRRHSRGQALPSPQRGEGEQRNKKARSNFRYYAPNLLPFLGYTLTTLTAWSPFGPFWTSNSTCWPSLKDLYPSP